MDFIMRRTSVRFRPAAKKSFRERPEPEVLSPIRRSLRFIPLPSSADTFACIGEQRGGQHFGNRSTLAGNPDDGGARGFFCTARWWDLIPLRFARAASGRHRRPCRDGQKPPHPAPCHFRPHLRIGCSGGPPPRAACRAPGASPLAAPGQARERPLYGIKTLKVRQKVYVYGLFIHCFRRSLGYHSRGREKNGSTVSRARSRRGSVSYWLCDLGSQSVIRSGGGSTCPRSS